MRTLLAHLVIGSFQLAAQVGVYTIVSMHKQSSFKCDDHMTNLRLIMSYCIVVTTSDDVLI